MVTYSLKRSYRLKDLEETDFRDLWGNYGIFTTMWIFGKPPKILFFENHIKNLIKSLKIFGIKKKSLKKEAMQPKPQSPEIIATRRKSSFWRPCRTIQP